MPRSIADQTIDELGGRGSVLVRQRNDHVELDRLLHELDG
ncbi:MAG: Hemerythrin cation binding domain protein, partial [Modestobacter sp.]|nr:Hemerythrin cation binding domain protein [Modestobacter sp.]